MRSTIRRRLKGAASIEYILLIGLVVLFIIVGLIAWRDSVNDFTSEVIAWVEGAEVPTAPVAMAAPAPADPPPAAPPPPPAATPAPTPSPTPVQDWANWLSGNWCGADGVNNLQIQQVDTGIVRMTRIYPDGRRESQYVNISSNGPDGFRETLADNPSWYVNDRRIDDNTWQIVGRADGRTGQIFRRC